MIYHFTYHLTVPLLINLTVDDFQNFPDNLLFCFANLVQYSVFDSEEAVVTGKLINLRYYVLHLLSNCFHLSTYIRREELLKFNISIMRLIKNGPIIQLIALNVSQNCFGPAKSLLAFGERLKSSEQRLNFLKRCKKNKILPKFIDVNVTVNYNVFPCAAKSPYIKSLESSLKSHILVQSISQTYQTIKSVKRDITRTKNDLKILLPHGDSYEKIVSLFEQNNQTTKVQAKKRLQQKYDWLARRNTTPRSIIRREDRIPGPQNVELEELTGLTIPTRTPEHSEEPPTETSAETLTTPQSRESSHDLQISPEEKVTPIQVELSPEERQLLELGPKFALTRRVDEKLMSSIKVEIAACAYRIRWVEHLKHTASCSTLSQHLKQDCPFQRPFAKAPPVNNVDMEDALKQLNNYVLELFQHSKVPFNLSPSEARGLKLLKARRSELHISVSDKGGEFVVMKRNDQKQLTNHHIMSTGVYKYLPPTRKQGGVLKPIANTTTTSFQRQIKSMTSVLEEKCNKLWSNICERRNLGSDMCELYKAHNTQLPTLYVLIKTHKFDTSDITENTDLSALCKVRPIVSCCGSPTEKLAWLCTKVLSSLLDHVPSHLRDIHNHLERLNQLSPEELRGKNFCSADVTSLYTNINIQGCIEDVISLASEHKDSLNMFGLELVDVHEMLELVFTSSYFVFDQKLYQQLLGLFMGCKPSPIGAIVRVYTFERRSVYVDPHYLPIVSVYGRYVDDAGTIAESEEQAKKLFELISDQDPDGHLGWEIDYPTTSDQFIPFLGTQIRISKEGRLEHKYYRKEQKKQITLNYRSHHPMRTKIEVAKNFYKTANIS